jgi:succinyl-diaminopimelate desuccinylase
LTGRGWRTTLPPLFPERPEVFRLVIDAHNPVELAQALIRCRSVTPIEGGALILLEKVLKIAGFDTHLETFSEPDTPDVTNLYARIGKEEPVLLLAGHTDVVPPGDEAAWTSDPFGGEIKDGVLYGRGAVDMKGGVAAMVSAVLRYLDAGNTAGSIAFLLTGDEEGPSVNGTPKLLEWAKARGEKFDHCLLAEPSSHTKVGDEIKIGRRGSLSGTIVVHGKQGHVAYPKLAENPIRRLMTLLAALNQPLDYGTPRFERSNLEITSVDVGNETANIIPAKATARFNVRFNDAHTLDGLKALITERLQRAATDIRYELVFAPNASSSFAAEPGPFVDMIASSIEAETGGRPSLSTAGGTSDARYIKNFCPVVEVGLVNATMHQVDERVAVEDLHTVTRVYGRIFERYFSQSASSRAVLPSVETEPKLASISAEGDLEAALEAALNAEAQRREDAAEAAATVLNKGKA